MINKILPSLLVAFSFCGISNAAILLTINIQDSSAVTFTATGNFASFDSSLNASQNGFTIEEFFTGAPSVNYVIGNVSGDLTPVTGTTQTYVAAGTYDFSDGTEAFKPANDLNITAGRNAGANSQVFTTGAPAFLGEAVMDLSSFAANLPTVGTSGTIYPGFSQGVQSIGEWTVVPEPSTLMFILMGSCGVFIRRRSKR